MTDLQMIDLDRNAVKAGRRRASLVLVDVREPHEFAAGHIPGSVSMPLSGSTRLRCPRAGSCFPAPPACGPSGREFAKAAGRDLHEHYKAASRTGARPASRWNSASAPCRRGGWYGGCLYGGCVVTFRTSDRRRLLERRFGVERSTLPVLSHDPVRKVRCGSCPRSSARRSSCRFASSPSPARSSACHGPRRERRRQGRRARPRSPSPSRSARTSSSRTTSSGASRPSTRSISGRGYRATSTRSSSRTVRWSRRAIPLHDRPEALPGRPRTGRRDRRLGPGAGGVRLERPRSGRELRRSRQHRRTAPRPAPLEPRDRPRRPRRAGGAAPGAARHGVHARSRRRSPAGSRAS